MLIATTNSVPGHTIVRTIGFVSGNSVKARHAGSSFIAGLKTIVGGEIGQFTKLMNDTRDRAMACMQENAAAMGANAIVGVRLASSEVMQGCSEICAYGTAVVVE